MWRHVHHRLVVGYHGCDRSVAERVLLRGEELKKSDLTDTDATRQLRAFYDDYRGARERANLPLHENRRATGRGDDLLRELDYAVLNLGLVSLDRAAGGGGYFYQTVRGVFVEGPEAYPGAAIRELTHVQVAVRDPACIVGYFMPASYPEEEA